MASLFLQFISPKSAKVPSPMPTLTLTASNSSVTIVVKSYQGPFIQAPEATYVSPYSQPFNSNQRTRNQFRPRNANKGTTSYQLRQYAEATLGGGSLRKIVKLPDGEDENEWLAVNMVDFYNHINLLYGSITEFCSPQSCPEMKATDECVIDIRKLRIVSNLTK
jgi:MOB kinase activator 1